MIFLAVSTARPPLCSFISRHETEPIRHDDPMFQALLLLPRGAGARAWSRRRLGSWWVVRIKLRLPLGRTCMLNCPLEAVHTAADIHNSQSTDRPSCLYSHVTARASGCTLVAPAPAADARAALRSRDACRSAW